MLKIKKCCITFELTHFSAPFNAKYQKADSSTHPESELYINYVGDP